MALFACAPVKEPGPEPEESVPPVAAGCALLGGIRATARSFPLGDGRTLWTLGSNASAITTSAGGPEECFAGTPVDPGPLVQGMPDAEPLAVVRAGQAVWMYFATPDGRGVAALDPATLRFQPTAMLLWTADRPSFGDAAVAQGGFVYAYGCAAAGFLRHDCYVARAPEDRVGDESAYAYYAGGGQWTARVDGAWPMLTAGPRVDVGYDARRRRFLMTYVPALG